MNENKPTMTVTEVVLENDFGVKPPYWLLEKDCLEPGHQVLVLV